MRVLEKYLEQRKLIIIYFRNLYGWFLRELAVGSNCSKQVNGKVADRPVPRVLNLCDVLQ